MTEQTNVKALPEMHPETETFFKSGFRSELVIKLCSDCQRFHHYPRAICPHCLSDRTVWIRASGKGTIYSFNIIRQNPSPGWRDKVPYVIAYVDLQEGVRMMTNIVGYEDVGLKIEDIKVGMPVQATWERLENVAIPQFRPIVAR